MTTWTQFEQEAPELAAPVRARFEAEKHHVLATLRADGSPRVSGTEVGFRAGHMHLGSMPGALKARDLQRDPRFALHAHTGDGSMAGGDAKVSGRVVELTDAEALQPFLEEWQTPGSFHLFVLDLEEVVLTTVGDNQLVITSWRAGRGVRAVSRA